MSYILDALKKSEQERKQGEVPGLNSLQNHPQSPRSTKRILFYLLIGFFLANILAIGLWVLLRQPPIPPPIVSQEQIVPEDTAQTNQPSQIDPATIQIAEVSTTTSQSQSVDKAKTEIPAPTEEKLPTPPETHANEATQPNETELTSDNNNEPEEDLQESSTRDKPKPTTFENLPLDIRNALPELTISAHYYSSNPSTRMASINGRVMRQGQAVTSGLVLDEIIHEGVIFAFRKYRFILKVFNR